MFNRLLVICAQLLIKFYMKMGQALDLRKHVYLMFDHTSKKEVAKHFQTANVPTSTIYNIGNGFENGLRKTKMWLTFHSRTENSG
jgi:hypothetical protein